MGFKKNKVKHLTKILLDTSKDNFLPLGSN